MTLFMVLVCAQLVLTVVMVALVIALVRRHRGRRLVEASGVDQAPGLVAAEDAMRTWAAGEQVQWGNRQEHR